ncbi:MAG: succinylglutamate desuccinylase/aspartoacylase family protein [Egibacteraceae bacterium]
MVDLYHRFDGYDDGKVLLEGSDEDVLVALEGKPALLRIPGTDRTPRARFVACLLHGNEDSGYRAVLQTLRTGVRHPFDLWVFIGNVRAASQAGWFANRYLDDQEDFNRVWGRHPPTTRMRRCADAVLAELSEVDLEACVDLHNNTGYNPHYAIVPVRTPASLTLAAACADTVLLWNLEAHTLMEALSRHCPTVAVECGLPNVPGNTAFAQQVLDRFVGAVFTGTPRAPERMLEMRVRVEVRPEVPFSVGLALSDEIDFVLRPGLDTHNFGMLLAGTELGHVHPGTAMPLRATDMGGTEVTERFFTLDDAGVVAVGEDLTPVMMTITVVQIRRDCLFYIARNC